MRYVAIAAAVVLSGCASTDKVMSKEAAEVYYSRDSVNTVAFCLANKNQMPVLDQDGGVKVVLIKNQYGGTAMAFTIFPHEGTGSKTEVRKQFGMIGVAWKQCVGAE